MVSLTEGGVESASAQVQPPLEPRVVQHEQFALDVLQHLRDLSQQVGSAHRLPQVAGQTQLLLHLAQDRPAALQGDFEHARDLVGGLLLQLRGVPGGVAAEEVAAVREERGVVVEDRLVGRLFGLLNSRLF